MARKTYLSAKDWANLIVEAFRDSANPANADPMAAYMKHRFQFFGIKRPARNEIQRGIFSTYGYPPQNQIEEVATILFADEYRESQYAALDILRHEVKKGPVGRWRYYDRLIVTKSWWDTVDGIATNILGAHLLLHSDLRSSVPGKLLSSKNMWRKRVAIIHQLKYGQDTDVDFLFYACRACAQSDEFFLQKAIGWALRQLSKTHEAAAIHFIESEELAPLSKREGLKWLKNQGRL